MLDGVELVVATRVGPAITLVVAVRSAARAHAVWHEAAVPDVPLRFVEHA